MWLPTDNFGAFAVYKNVDFLASTFDLSTAKVSNMQHFVRGIAFPLGSEIIE